ncbi:hypothetical protein Z945_2100 [Sulfitobacter noctilucae]|uniref:hypothetical protein n=1 Tax=Sulfitobacter noctilucae TaxID=1342302 RepID=UPI00046A6A2C|nr:hypothetical protein [Sulfitobacter noctilucae]KIN61115.1 hypothetical protein Z945_2100 [Sulfitobacter noctilucae]
MLRKTLLAFTLFAAPSAHAAEVPPAMSQYIYGDLMAWVNNDQIVQAISAQNRSIGELNQTEIIARDGIWRTEIGETDRPTVNAVLNAPLSDFLRSRQSESNGRITEVFVMDRYGLNVAASDMTSDYWQGDEAKFTETFARGSGAVYIGDIELDESSQTYQGQVSFAVTDPETGSVIGAITVGLNAEPFY